MIDDSVKILQVLAWPGAVVLIAVTVLITFKGKASALLDRRALRRLQIGSSGISAEIEPQREQSGAPLPLNSQEAAKPSPQQRKTFAQAMESASITVLDVESAIKKEMLSIEFSSPDQKEALLLRELAATRVDRYFLETDSLIRGTQLSLLVEANGYRGAMPEAEAKKFYDHAVATFPRYYEGIDFVRYLAFLLGRQLIEPVEGGLSVTQRGRDFLQYLVRVQRTRNNRDG
ncbi:MAG: hypothetical protein IT580_14690 [Verrucomicrobiales bacterium]|nr:hypothetical protein [Verrucomicrobiales bacterium]